MLLVATGLVVQSVRNARQLDPGFDTKQIVMASVNPGIRGDAEDRARDLYRRILEEVAAIPNVERASIASALPLDDSTETALLLVEGYGRREDENNDTPLTRVGPHYFETMGTAVLQGREFDDRDRPDTRRVAIVNEALASRYWPGQNAIGKRFRFDGQNEPFVEVVGVAKTGKDPTLGEGATPFVFLPLSQHHSGRVRVIARVKGDPLAATPGLLRAIRRVDDTLPVFGVRSIAGFLERSMWGTGAAAALLGTLGVFVLVLAAVGLHGLISWSVAQRTREIGIRLALGASVAGVRSMVVRQGLTIALTGVAAGAVGAIGLTRLIRHLLLAVSPNDPATFVLMAVLLCAAALLAAYGPARRASRLHPVQALRHD